MGFEWDFSKAAKEVPDLPQELAGHEVRGQLGAGGMGVVYRAWDPALEREVAIKLVRCPDETLLERFRREAHALARLRHPNVIAVHALVEHEGALCLVMPLVDGQTLEDRVALEGPLEPEEATGIAVALAGALHHAHEAGLLHRDVKPSNVILSPEGPLLTDFGLVLELSDAERLTQTGAPVGTPAFMAPEQWRGKAAIDRRVDVFGLGATLHFALTGGASRSPRSLPGAEVPAPLARLTARALEPDPAKRYPTCREFAEALERAWDPPASPRRAPALVALVGLVLLLLVGAARFGQPSATPRAVPRVKQSSPLPSRSPAPSPALWQGSPSTGALAQRRLLRHRDVSKARFLSRGAVSLSGDRVVFWDLARGKRARELVPLGEEGFRELLVTSPGKVAFATDSTLRVCDEAGATLWTRKARLSALAWSLDGELLACGSGGRVELRSARGGELLETLDFSEHRPHLLAFGPRDQLAVATEDDQHPPTLTLWRKQGGRFERQQQTPLPSEAIALAFDPRGEGVFFGDDNGFLVYAPTRAWTDFTTRVFRHQERSALLGDQAHGVGISTLVFPRSDRILSASHTSDSLDHGMLKLWDAQSGELLASRPRQANGFRGIDISSSGRQVLLVSREAGWIELTSLGEALDPRQ